MMEQALKNCNKEGENYFKHYGLKGIPGFSWYKRAIEQKLINAGFKEEFIKQEIWFKGLIYTINFEQGLTYSSYRWDLNPPFGFPLGTYEVSEDKHTLWINSDIEAALLTLETMKKLEELLMKDGGVNNEVLKACIHSFQLAINLVRSGLLPKWARQGKIQSNSNRSKGQKRWLKSAEEIEARNRKIKEHYQKACAKGNISRSGFAKKYGKKYGLGITQMTKIIKSSP